MRTDQPRVIVNNMPFNLRPMSEERIIGKRYIILLKQTTGDFEGGKEVYYEMALSEWNTVDEEWLLYGTTPGNYLIDSEKLGWLEIDFNIPLVDNNSFS